uniref:Uncharacterized protein n=1 Tax=Romanomermis culicivorax TaxID=13658 RepID=A0A915HPW6_ROMCU
MTKSRKPHTARSTAGARRLHTPSPHRSCQVHRKMPGERTVKYEEKCVKRGQCSRELAALAGQHRTSTDGVTLQLCVMPTKHSTAEAAQDGALMPLWTQLPPAKETPCHTSPQGTALPCGAGCPIHTNKRRAVPCGGFSYLTARHRAAPCSFTFGFCSSQKNIYRLDEEAVEDEK